MTHDYMNDSMHWYVKSTIRFSNWFGHFVLCIYNLFNAAASTRWISVRGDLLPLNWSCLRQPAARYLYSSKPVHTCHALQGSYNTICATRYCFPVDERELFMCYPSALFRVLMTPIWVYLANPCWRRPINRWPQRKLIETKENVHLRGNWE